MENTFKRFLSLVLAFTMVLSYVPVNAFADDTLHEHVFAEGFCECGEADPNYQPPETEAPATEPPTTESPVTGAPETEAPGCSHNYVAGVCTVCSEVDPAAIVSEDDSECAHNYVILQSSEPSCTNTGFTSYWCGGCSTGYEETTAALGHNYVEGICSRCSEKEPFPLPEVLYVDVGDATGDFKITFDGQNYPDMTNVSGSIWYYQIPEDPVNPGKRCHSATVTNRNGIKYYVDGTSDTAVNLYTPIDMGTGTWSKFDSQNQGSEPPSVGAEFPEVFYYRSIGDKTGAERAVKITFDGTNYSRMTENPYGIWSVEIPVNEETGKRDFEPTIHDETVDPEKKHYLVAESGKNLFDGATATWEEYIPQVVANVARIGEIGYATLQEALNAAAAASSDVTVEILEDIDLTDVVWTPVSVSAPHYPCVTVEGNYKTITGLSDMLFSGTWAGKSGLIINDLTIANSNIVHDEKDANGNIGVGAFVGFPQASETITLKNCHLVDSTVNGGHWTGGLVGYAAGYAGTDGPVFMTLTIEECSVTDSTITGKGSVGGLIGHGSGNAWTKVIIKDTKVSGNTITSTGSSTNKAGAVVGTIGAAGQPTTVNGVKKTGGAFVAAEVSDNPVTSNGITITTVYGRQGTSTGTLEITGGEYDHNPIEQNVAYAYASEGYEIAQNSQGKYVLTEKSATPETPPAVVVPENIVDTVVGESANEEVKQAVAEIVKDIQSNAALTDEDYKPVETLEDVKELVVTLTNMTLDENKTIPTKIVFTVEPKNAEGNKVSAPTQEINFRLPIPASMKKAYAKVYHGTELMGTYETKGSANAWYVEVSSKSFSEYAVEPTDEAAPANVAQIGEKTYSSLQAAIDAASTTDTIVILGDVTEEITSLKGNLVSGVEGGVTITGTYSSWVYAANNFTIGEGVTFKTPYLFAYCTNGVINGTVELSAQLYMRYAGAKLTINAPGKMVITGENAIIRYMDGDAEAGLYINGDNDDSTVEFKAPYISFYSGIISAKDAVIETGVLWQTNSTDSAEHGAAHLKLDNSKLNMTVNEHTFKADDNSKIELINGSAMNIAGKYQVADSVQVVVDKTSSIKAQDYEYVQPVAKIGDKNYGSLQAAVDAVQNGETITLLDDIAETLVTIEKASGVAFTIEGGDHKFTGELEIGIGENLTIQNVKFVASAEISPEYFIDSMDKNSNCVLTITNCSFTDTDYSTTAIGTHQPTQVVIDGCEAEGVASLLQNQGGYNITVKNTTVEGKRGMSLGSVIGATVENVTINAANDKYGIRLNGENNNNTITIKNVTISAFIPVVVRKAQVENYNVLFEGTNTMTPANTDGLWCAIGTSEYDTNGTMPTAATGKVTVTLNDAGLNKKGMYGHYVAPPAGSGTEADPILITSLEDLEWLRDKVDEQAADGSTQFAGKYFKLTADIDLDGINWNPIGSMSGDHGTFKGVFDGDGHTISNLNVEQAGNGLGLFARTAGNAVIKDLTLNNVTVKSTDNSNYVGGLVGNSYASTKIENVHVTGKIDISGRGYIGGISGHGYVVMDNVSVVGTGTISSTFWCAGGILGYGGEGTTNIQNAHVEGITITSAAGGLGAIVGMAEDNEGTQPISGSNLSAKNVTIKTYTGAYGDSYANYALGYLYGGNPTSKLTGTLAVENVKIETSNGETPEVQDAVATIGNAVYFNLQDAFNAGGEVKLLRNVTLTDTVTVPADKTVTLNLNGKTISQTKAQTAGYEMILNDGNLTIQDSDGNGKISYTDSGNGGEYTSNTITNRGTLTLESGTVENLSSETVANNGYPYAIDTSIWGAATEVNTIIEGGKVVGASYSAMRLRADSETKAVNVTVTGGEVVGTIEVQNPSSTVAGKGKLTISGGKLSKSGTDNVLYFFGFGGAGNNIVVSVTGGEFGGEIKQSATYPVGEGFNTKFITGGIFNSPSVGDYLADGYWLKFENKKYIVYADVVASVDGEDYSTLEEAFAAAYKTGYKVNLEKDITLTNTLLVTGTVTLDLKGHTITGKDNNKSGNFYLINNTGKLTIKDSKGDGKITLEADYQRYWNASSVVVANNPGGELIVESGTIEHLGGTDMAYGIDNLTNGDTTSAVVTINGGTIKSTYSAVRQFLNGNGANNTLTINGGTLEATKRAVFFQAPTAKKPCTGTLIIGKDAEINNTVYLGVTAGSTEWDVDVSISAEALKNGAEIQTANIPDGYGLVLGDDGIYTVKSGVAKIGEEYYTTIDAALAAAKNGDTIVLMKDAALTKVYTMNGMKLTIEGEKKLTINDASDKNLLKVSGESTLNISAAVAGEVWLEDGAILKDSTINGDVFVAGKVIFRGNNTVNMLYDFGNLTGNYGTAANMEWSVEPGSALTMNAKARYGLGYGDNVTITGNLTSVDRENETEADRSFFTHGIVAQESKGWNCSSSMTVKDAYVVIGSNNSFGNKPGNYGGNYTFNFENAILDSSRITFYEAQSKTEFNITGSDVKTGTFMTRDADSVFTITNSKLISTATTNGNDEGNYHAGKLVLANSELSYSAQWKLENGTVEMDLNSKITAPSIIGTGVIVIDATAFNGTDVELISGIGENYTGTIEVKNNADASYRIEDGKIIVTTAPVAEVGGVSYTILQEALKAVKANDTVTILRDITITEDWDCRNTGAKIIADNVTIDGNGKTLKFTGKVDDKNWNTIFRFEGDNATVKNLKLNVSEATGVQRGVTSKLSITVESCEFIGNGTSAKYGIIFGEGAGTAIGNVTATVTDSTFKNWSKGLSDNANAQDVKSVTAIGNTFTNAGVSISAAESTTFTGNTISNAEAVITCYNGTTETVTVTGNTLENGATGRVKNAASYENIQPAFTIEAPVAVTANGVTKYFNGLAAAATAIATNGTDTTIKLTEDIEVAESIEFVYGNGKIIFTADEPVTVKQTKNGLDLLFVDGKPANIVVDEKVTFEISDNAAGMYLYYGPSLNVNGTITGGANWGCLYLFNGNHVVSETGKVTVGRVQSAFNTVTVNGEMDTNYLLVEGGEFIADGAKIDANVIYDNNNGGQRWGASKFAIKNGAEVTTSKLALSYADSEMTIDLSSKLKADTITGAGKIVIDGTGYQKGIQPIDGKVSNFTGTIEVINNDDLKVVIDDEGNVSLQEKVYVAKISENEKFESLAEAIAAVQEGETVTILAGTLSEGTIKLPAALKNVTIKGEEGAVLKDMTISAADGNSYSYVGLTFDGITFDNSRIILTGWRNGDETIENLTVTNCTFKNLDDTTSEAAVHINKDASEPVKNFTFTNNVIDGATGGSKSGVYAQVTGTTTFTGNTINNVAFRPYVIQVTTDDGIADEFTVTDNTFSGSAAGRAQGLGSNAEGTDTVKLVVSENIFKGITDSQQICYWNFNPETTTADLSKNYYDIDITANPGKIYFNGSASDVEDLIEMGVYPYYADEAKTQLVEAPAIMVTYPVGNPVYPEGKVEYYNDMLEAVPYTTNCPRLEGATITLLKDTSGAGLRFMENDMVFDLNGHTYTITAGTGSQGTNTSGFQIRSEVTTDVIFKNGTINVAAGAPVVWMFNCYATDFIVENVTVDCANMAWSYGESCYVVVSREGDNVQFTGTTKIENFNSQVAGNAINVGGTMTIGESVVPGGSIELDVGATLTAPKGLVVNVPEDKAEDYAVVYSDGIYSTALYVAETNGTKYVSLQDAINAGSQVKLLADVALTETVTIPAGKTVTLDLNGKTISQTKEQTEGYQMILNDGNLNINDSSADGTGKISYTDSGNGGNYISDTIYNRGILVINGGTIENLSSETVANNGFPHAVDTYSGIRNTSVTINGGTIYCAEYSAIRMFCVSATNKADLIINGGTIKGSVDMQNGTAAAALGSLTVNGGTFEITKNTNNIRFANWNSGAETYGITAEVKGGTFNGGFSDGYVPAAANWNKNIISGGTFTGTVVEDFLAEGYILSYISGSGNQYGVEMDAVARVGTTTYSTIQAAIDAAPYGQTVYVLKNVELKAPITVAAGKKLTLDLMGSTITGKPAEAAAYAVITNKGDLTIANGTVKCDHALAGSTAYAVNTIVNGGTLTIDGAVIENVSTAEYQIGYAIDNNSTTGNAVLTINSGKVTASGSKYYDGIRLFCNSLTAVNSVTVNGGEVSTIWLQNPSDGSDVRNTKDVKGNVTITDGTVGALYLEPSANFTASVKGGHVNKVAYNESAEGRNLTGIISGGTFTEKPDDKLAAEGYRFVQDETNQVYGVELMPALSGTGTQADPYLITNLDELILFRDSVNKGETKYSAPGVWVALGADIDMTGENWTPIGSPTADHGFMGNFDGKGYTIKNLTITDPTLDSDGYAYAGLFAITEGTENAQNVIQNLTIENVTISTTGHIVSAAIAYPYYTTVNNITVCGDISITGGDYTSGVLAYTRRCTDASNLSVVGNDGSTITGKMTVGGVISDIQMNGGLTADYSGFHAENVIVTGDMHVGGISGIIGGQTLNGATVKNVTLVCDDNRVGQVSGSLGQTSTITNAAVENVTGAKAVIGGAFDNGAAVEAKIGDVYYATFKAAHDAAEDGDTITLLAPVTVPAGETLTLDKAVDICYTTDVAGEAMFINNGTMTVDGANLVFTYTGVADSAYGKGNYTVINGGELTLKSGSIENATAKMSHASYAVQNGGNATFTMDGGLVKNTNNYAIRQFASGSQTNTVTINGGEVIGTRAVWIQAAGSDAANEPTIALNVNGGTLTSTGESENFKLAVYSYSYGDSLKNVSVNVEGGTVNGDIALTGGKNKTAAETVNIIGGTFYGDVYSYAEDEVAVSAISITGGQFATNAADAYIADEGNKFVQNANGMYEPAEIQYVAQIGDKKYETLQDAVDAADEFANITLIGDPADDYIMVNKQLNIVLNGNTFDGDIFCGKDAEKKQLTDTWFDDKIVIGRVQIADSDAGEAVAYIDVGAAGHDGEELMTLQKALNEAEANESSKTVKLIKDLNVNGTVIIPVGVTLDIEKYTLTVKNLIGLNTSKINAATDVTKNDNQFDGGKLVVAKSNLILSKDAYYKAANDRYIVPFWDPNNNCYVFGTMLIRDTGSNRGVRYLTDAEGNKYLELQFRHVTNTDINDILLEDDLGADDNAAKFEVMLSWETDTGVAYEHFVYNADQVGKVAGKEEAVTGKSYDFLFTLDNYDELEGLTITGIFVTDCGIEVTGQKFNVKN